MLYYFGYVFFGPSSRPAKVYRAVYAKRYHNTAKRTEEPSPEDRRGIQIGNQLSRVISHL